MEAVQPKVSVIVPCYNSGKFVAETLSCVSKTDYPNWECVIVNDGSTDNSEIIVSEFSKNDSRFRLVTQANSGPSAARNMAIKHCTGEYVLPLDADDLISKDYIKEAAEILTNRPEIKLVYCLARKFGRKNQAWKLPDYSFEKLLVDNMIFCTAMFRKSDFTKTRGFDETMRSGREDWDFWIEFLKDGGQVFRIEKVHFFYRTHKRSHNKTANESIASIREHISLKHRDLYSAYIKNTAQLLWEHSHFKKKYNIIRRLMFKKPLP
ncbi:MAG TPA: glycosyltransferase family A protein [Bacteroidales bacterium]|nr:glycosyltransferase family A protein [Bacteroidales bacterium]